MATCLGRKLVAIGTTCRILESKHQNGWDVEKEAKFVCK